MRGALSPTKPHVCDTDSSSKISALRGSPYSLLPLRIAPSIIENSGDNSCYVSCMKVVDARISALAISRFFVRKDDHIELSANDVTTRFVLYYWDIS
jgi:hypothetical protein